MAKRQAKSLSTRRPRVRPSLPSRRGYKKSFQLYVGHIHQPLRGYPSSREGKRGSGGTVIVMLRRKYAFAKLGVRNDSFSLGILWEYLETITHTLACKAR